MRSLPLIALLASACGSDLLDGPFAPLPVDISLEVVGLDGPVDVARDRFGLMHIRATTAADATFVLGYVMAHDRFPQMDVMRRMAQGTLAELYGELDPRVIDTDLRMRMHRILAYAEQTHADLEASTDPRDVQLVATLDRFTAGVNAYVLDLQAGRWTLDPDLAEAFDAAATPAWTPADSLSIARFHAFAMSWTAPLELELTDLYQRLRATFEGTPRAAIIPDLLAFAPIGRASTLPGFPDAAADAPATPRTPPRPAVPQPLLDRARATLAPGPHDGVLGALGPHAFLQPFIGSNAWAIGEAQAAGGGATGLLAVDHQLPLSNPSVLYPVHVSVQPDPTSTEPPLDVVGLALPGMPGTVVGSNGTIAWANTVGGHDVNDLYLEQCDATSCSGPDGGRSITELTELIGIGHRGEIRSTMTVTYEHVEGHGPIIPEIRDGALVPRAAGPALAVRYTGYANSFEARAFTGLAGVTSLEDALALVADASYGGPWTFLERSGRIAWTADATIPIREPAAYAWHVRDVPDGAAPFFVLDGRGGHDWTDVLGVRHVPRIDPGTRAFAITADADPVGATYDGDPLDQRDASGNVLYAGVAYDAGLRETRALELLAVGASPSTIDLERAQHDPVSTLGARVAPAIVQALSAVDGTSAPADVAPYLATLTSDQLASLRAARTLLAEWTFTAPTLAAGTDGDARATTVFHTWIHFFTRDALGDELAQAGYPIERFAEDRLARLVHAITSGTAAPHPQTGEAMLCDRVASAEVESCTRLALEAMVAALAHLANVDDASRVWGHVHRLAFGPLFHDPTLAFRLPSATAPGFPRGGDMSSIARAPHGWDDLDFTPTSASAHRFDATAVGSFDAIRVRLELPSGTVLDKRDTHYRDLVDTTFVPETPFDVPMTIDEINEHGESRWEFR